MFVNGAIDDDDPRTLLLVDPGWVQTELGGEGVPPSVAESIRWSLDPEQQTQTGA